MQTNLRKKTEGFTIIEVLIVLVIAGLIMLIVFLAVPALQRNSRNTQRRNDIGSIACSYNEYVNNNNAVTPASVAVASDGTLTVGASGTNQTTTKLGYYTSGVSLSATAPVAAGTNGTTTDTVVVYAQANCNAAGTLAVPAAGSRSFAITYTLESNAKLCQAS